MEDISNSENPGCSCVSGVTRACGGMTPSLSIRAALITDETPAAYHPESAHFVRK
jgi:hypothetical protein